APAASAPEAAPPAAPQAAELPAPAPVEQAPTELQTQAQETVDPAATGTSWPPLLAVAVGAVVLFLAGAWAGRRLRARP
ncbi:hypothetical protein, partial [Geodermatophilus sp. CPCC 205506]|uniref:hypothetical protein n=1 Tax=Geodermatophilus sp. CPCC 205506 TaxID=2936596 RepID=UPI003EE87251